VTVAVDRFHAPDPGVASQQVLGSAEIQNLRGVAADDPLRAVQVLPGVATGDDLRSEFSVRGSGFGQMNLTVDGFASPYLLHTVRAVEDFSQSGSVAMINSDILEDVTLLNGGYAQRFGNRTGGEVNFRLREGSRDRTAARLAVSGTAASVVLEGPLGAARRGSWLVSGRHSYLHLIVERLLEDEGIRFRFADAQAKFVYDLTPTQRAELALLTGRSRFRSTPPELETDDVFDGRNATAMAVSTWRMAGRRSILTAKGMWAWNGFSNDDAWSDVRLDEGGDRQLAGRLDATVDLGGGLNLETGAQAERTSQWRLRRRYIPPIYRVVNDYDAAGTRGGVYSLVRWTSGPVTLAPGARADRWSVTGETTASPWIQGEWRAGAATTVRGGAGIYRQFPEFEHAVGALRAASPGASRAGQYDLGLERRIGEALRVQVTGYRRVERGFFRRAGAETFFSGHRLVVGDPRAPFEQRLDGVSRGVELLVQRRHPNGLSGWISYAYGVHRRQDTVTGERYPADLDQRHTLNVYGVLPAVGPVEREREAAGRLEHAGAGLLRRGRREVRRHGAAQRVPAAGLLAPRRAREPHVRLGPAPAHALRGGDERAQPRERAVPAAQPDARAGPHPAALRTPDSDRAVGGNIDRVVRDLFGRVSHPRCPRVSTALASRGNRRIEESKADMFSCLGRRAGGSCLAMPCHSNQRSPKTFASSLLRFPREAGAVSPCSVARGEAPDVI
jgi:hypothetical protein